MIYPFIWQFSFDINKEKKQSVLAIQPELIGQDDCWEKRYFWPEQEPVVLRGMPAKCLSLSEYKIESRTDTYLFVDERTNIKIRKNKLHIKPLLQSNKNGFCYSKKIKYHLEKDQAKLSHALEGSPTLTGNSRDVKQQLMTHFSSLDVIKDSLVLPLTTCGRGRLEFSRLLVGCQYFHSLSVEMPDLQLLTTTVKQLGIKGRPQAYVDFLMSVRNGNDN